MLGFPLNRLVRHFVSLTPVHEDLVAVYLIVAITDWPLSV